MQKVKIPKSVPRSAAVEEIQNSLPSQTFVQWSNEIKKLNEPILVINNAGRTVSKSRHRRAGYRC